MGKSIRRELFAVSLGSIAVVWCFSAAVLFFQHRAATAQAVAANDRLGVLANELVSLYFEERLLYLRHFAAHGEELSGKGRGTLEAFYRDFPYYEDLLVLDSNGIVRKSIPANPSIEGFDFSARDFFRNARQGEIFLSEVYTSLATGQAIITGSIRTAGGYVIAADLNINALSETMDRIRPSDHGFLAILDRDGRYVYHPDLDLVITKKLNLRYNEQFRGRGIDGVAHYDELVDGRRMLVTASVVAPTGWTVLAYYDYANETRRTLELLKVSLALLAGLLAAVFAITYRGIGRVGRVLGDFVERTNRIARGDGSIALGEVGYEEFKALSENFDAMARSVTEREEELRKLNAELESKVAERTEELARANRSLRASNEELGEALRALKETQSKIIMTEKMTALGRISAGIAHELNTPLGVIGSNLQLIVRCLERDLAESIDLLSTLGPAARRFAREASLAVARSDPEVAFRDPAEQRRERALVLAALSGTGRGEAFSMADTLVSLGIPELAGEALPLLAEGQGEAVLAVLRGFVLPIYAAKVASLAVGQASQVSNALRSYSLGDSSEAPAEIGLARQLRSVLALFRSGLKRGISVSLDIEEDITVWGRSEEIARIWFNLIANSIRAIEAEGTITIWAERVGARTDVHVTDTGRGIPEELKASIFTPFFTTRSIGEGSGLGLDTSRRLARANGGDIRFTSGGGRTDFVVTLLAARPEGAGGGGPGAGGEGPGAGGEGPGAGGEGPGAGGEPRA